MEGVGQTGCAWSYRENGLANGSLPDALHTAPVSLTRRSSGGYTLAISGRARVDPTPQQFRFGREFVPMFARRWRISLLEHSRACARVTVPGEMGA